MHSIEGFPYKTSHDSGKKYPTVPEVKKEARRLRLLYRRRIRNSKRPGPEPKSAVFILEAIRRLSALKNPKSTGRKEREYLEEFFPDISSYDLQNLYRSRAHKDIRWAANWDDLRRGQEVFNEICQSGGASARQIQQKMSISKNVLGNLPMPSPFLRKVRTGKQIKFVFVPPKKG